MDTMSIWDAVAKTDPAYTKHVGQRGGFTAIAAHYQVMSATKQFGPVGIGWGYANGDPIFHESLVFVPVSVWHGNRENVFGPVYGGAEWKTGSRTDSDAIKKAATDGLTKALSHLGFNADVFLGLFDDSKYVNQLRNEFAGHAPDQDGVERLIIMIEGCETVQALQNLWAQHSKYIAASPDKDRLTAAKDARKVAILETAKVTA